MGRIHDKNLYPLDTVVSKDDYVLGTDVDQNLKTVNFNLGSIIRLINSELNFSSAEFRYSAGDDPEITVEDQGFFFSNSLTNSPADTTKISINEKTVGGINLDDLFILLGSNVHTFSLKLINSSDPSDSFYFKVKSVVAHANWFELDVEVIGQNYLRNLTDLTTYNVYLEVIGTQDNKNLVKNVSIDGDITTAAVVAAINALPQFVVSDTQSVYYSATNLAGKSVTFIPVGLGKGTYGTGGTQLVSGDITPITSGTVAGGGGSTIIKKFTVAEYSETAVADAINAGPTFSLVKGDNPFFYVTASGATYILLGVGLVEGDYGIGGSLITTDNLELVATLSNLNVIKAVAVVGEVTNLAVADAINALPAFNVHESQNAYFKVAQNGTTYMFILKDLGAGAYGTGGKLLAGTDLEMISVTSGGSSWKLNVGGVAKKTIPVGGTVDFRQAKYAVVAYTADGVVTISTSQELDDLLASFKPTVVLTKTEYNNLKETGQLQTNTIYAKTCS